ncbi:MAG: flagellar motor switch phosphatase FliY [Bacillota bacterium]
MSMSQAEIDALLNGGMTGGTEVIKDAGNENTCKDLPEGNVLTEAEEDFTQYLLPQELDTVCEIGNITMGNASTPLSELLGVPVNISNPQSYICYQEKVYSSFNTPYLSIQVDFIKGLKGFNVLVIKEDDVAVIADLMLGGNGKPDSFEVSEMAISAASEAMNQMNGAAATALSDMFGEAIDISPPKTTHIKELKEADHHPLPTDGPVVVVKFMLSVGDLLDTTIMQITGVETAKEQVALLYKKMGIVPPREALEQDRPDTGPESPVAPEEHIIPDSASDSALEIAMNIPLEISLVSGRVSCRVADIAGLKPGSVLDVNSSLNLVEMVANGKVVALGELKDGRFKVVKLTNQ